MEKVSAIIIDPIGLHARPATTLVTIAKTFQSEIKISANGKSADAKGMLSIMALGIKKDQEIVIEANGSDEVEAIEKITTKLREEKVIA